MIRETQWMPDTCGCILKYQWDDAEPDDSRTHKASEPVFKCELHDRISDPQAHLEAVLAHNRAANV